MDKIEIIEGEQGDDAWKTLKLGIPSASCFLDVMTGGGGKTRDVYLRKLAGEIMSGQPREEFRSAAMERGNVVEPELRAQFQIETGLHLHQVAFIRRTMPFGVIGASPDALIGDDAGLEIKSAAAHILIDTLRSGTVPREHLVQIQGNLLVSGREHWHLAIGSAGLPMFRRVIERDTAYCAQLEIGLRTFYRDLNELVAWLRRYGRDA